MNEALLPGVFDKKTNCKIHYLLVVSVFVILVLILIITGVTVNTVSRIHETATKTQLLIEDMNILLPEAKLFLQLRGVLCKDNNFTRFYSAYANVLC